MGKKFNKLEHIVEREYEKKGYPKKEAKYIGEATAAKIFRNKR